MKEELELPESLTDLVLAAGHGRWGAALFDVCSRALTIAVRAKRVRLPRYVGMDHDRWSPEVYRDLCSEFYGDKLLPHWDVLESRARTEGIGPGLLLVMAKQFIADRRRLCDPTGSASFKKLRSAMRGACARGELVSVVENCRVDQHSVFHVVGSRPGTRADGTALHRALLDYQDRRPLLARFRTRGEVETRELASLWAHLRICDIAEFRFDDLLSALRDSAMTDLCESAPVQEVTDTVDEFEQIARLARGKVMAAPLQDTRRSQLLFLLDSMLESTRHPGSDTVNLAEVGRGMGLSKQRASELRLQLAQVLGPGFAERLR